MPKYLREVWQTEYGKVFGSEAEAVEWENREGTKRCFNQAYADAHFTDFRRCVSRNQHQAQLLELLLARGFKWSPR